MYELIFKHNSIYYNRIYFFKTKKELKGFLKDVIKSNRQNEIASINRYRKNRREVF